MPETITRIQPNHRRSRAVVVGNMVHVGGQFADNYAGDIAAQTGETLAKLDALLAECCSDRSHLVSVTIWLRDMGDFDAMNAVYDAWIDPANPPTRCCGEVRMAHDDMRIEITALARLR
ncbi:RidA family protein [Seohaeicola nanhaiensis]|uniref:RidA family protein n=1 Tax=Seohaeicola nanhaiensis TaxID=1387282 RepID=A0ABV9KC44_9RHOB